MTKRERLAREIWRVAYDAACKADPKHYSGKDTWSACVRGRVGKGWKAGWMALADYVLKARGA